MSSNAKVKSRQVAWSWPRVAMMRRAALELVYPASCVSCRAEMGADFSAGDDLPICKACVDELELFCGPVCGLCGAPVPEFAAKERVGCSRCAGRKLWFDETIAAGEYTGHLRDLLLVMKRGAGDSVSLAMSQLLWQQCGERLRAARADVVVPIPMHWRRRLGHGTNSAAVLAEVLAGKLGVPMAAGLLRRRRHTAPQFSLLPAQRWENVRGAFSVRAGYHLRRANVLLVDDILTTGATCSTVARTLKRAGAERVTVVVVGRALKH